MSKKWFEWFLVAVSCFALGASMCSCTAEEVEDTDFNTSSACILGDCEVNMYPDPAGQPDAYLDSNGYYHIYYFGAKYFGVKAEYSPLKGQYMPGGVPTIRTSWDTNFWYTVIEGVKLLSNVYNPLQSDYTMNFSMVLPTETREINVPVSEISEIYNISGQYMREGKEGPMQYTGVNSKFYSKKMFTLMPEMVGDTISITAESVFAYDSSKKESYINEIKVIIQ